MKTYGWMAGSGRKLYLEVTMDDAESCNHPGQCDADVDYLCDLDRIQVQTAVWHPADLVDELHEYGAWEVEDLQDHEENIRRMVWIACGDVTTDPDSYEVG